jgi:hypothetical protein
MTFALAAQWALKNWKLVLGGLAVAVLGIMLVIAKGDARHWHAKFDNAEAGRLNEIAKHKITIASVNTCTKALKQQSKAVANLKAETDKRQAEAAQAVKTAQRASLSAETKARALEASAAGNRAEKACMGSAAYQASRGGL